MTQDDFKVLATNRRARFEYEILETFEAGLVLTGTEIKSVRAGKASLAEGYARVVGNEAWLEDVHVAPYAQGGRENPEPRRRRKLLLHRDEIRRLADRLGQQGLTLVPLRLYLKDRRVKAELGLARGKKLYDKREAIAERSAQREIERAIKTR
ncbi:MAG: SsrA-binding protein SmpB [Chloroflexi bacterium]|nr:SsrA-binding protein SmpB [Chloroflexota bacterium]